MVKPSHLLSTNTGPMGPPGPPILCPFILWLVVVVASGQEADVVVVKVTSNHHGNNDARTSWLVNGGGQDPRLLVDASEQRKDQEVGTARAHKNEGVVRLLPRKYLKY